MVMILMEIVYGNLTGSMLNNFLFKRIENILKIDLKMH